MLEMKQWHFVSQKQLTDLIKPEISLLDDGS